MGLNTSSKRANEGTAEYYGHADYERDRASGMSDSAILRLINADPSKMGNGGVGGDLFKQIQLGANSGGSGSGSGDFDWSRGDIDAGSYSPPEVNFNPGGIDMGGDMSDVWSNEDFIRGLAKERAEAFTDGRTVNQNQSIVNNIEQNIGNKGDWETIIGDNNTFNNSSIGNDYSLNMGSINVANKQNQFAV
jgi:hypothetical protein